MWPFRKKRTSRSKQDLEAVIEQPAKHVPDDLAYDEVTDVINLTLERATQAADSCQKAAKDAVEQIKSVSDTIRLPAQGPAEKLG